MELSALELAQQEVVLVAPLLDGVEDMVTKAARRIRGTGCAGGIHVTRRRRIAHAVGAPDTRHVEHDEADIADRHGVVALTPLIALGQGENVAVALYVPGVIEDELLLDDGIAGRIHLGGALLVQCLGIGAGFGIVELGGQHIGLAIFRDRTRVHAHRLVVANRRVAGRVLKQGRARVGVPVHHMLLGALVDAEVGALVILDVAEPVLEAVAAVHDVAVGKHHVDLREQLMELLHVGGNHLLALNVGGQQDLERGTRLRLGLQAVDTAHRGVIGKLGGLLILPGTRKHLVGNPFGISSRKGGQPRHHGLVPIHLMRLAVVIANARRFGRLRLNLARVGCVLPVLE